MPMVLTLERCPVATWAGWRVVFMPAARAKKGKRLQAAWACNRCWVELNCRRQLLENAADFLAIAFARERRFHAALLARRHVEGVPFDFADNVFLLHFAFEPAQGAFKRLVIAEFDLCQCCFTSLSLFGAAERRREDTGRGRGCQTPYPSDWKPFLGLRPQLFTHGVLQFVTFCSNTSHKGLTNPVSGVGPGPPT